VVSSFFFFSSPNLSRRRLDVYHTCTHGVALVRIEDACLKRAARGLLQIRDAKSRQKIANWAPSQKLSGYIISTKAHIDNRKKNLLSSNISSTYSHNIVNFGPLVAEIVLVVWGYPCIFQRVSRLGSVTARHSSIGRQPNFAALNIGRHLYSAGRLSRWALALILVLYFVVKIQKIQHVFGQSILNTLTTKYFKIPF